MPDSRADAALSSWRPAGLTWSRGNGGAQWGMRWSGGLVSFEYLLNSMEVDRERNEDSIEGSCKSTELIVKVCVHGSFPRAFQTLVST